MRDKILFLSCFGFVLGVLIRSFVFVNISVILFLGILAFTIIFFFTLISKNKWGVISGIFILAFSLGLLRFHIADKSMPVFFEAQMDESVSLSGLVVDEPDFRENNQKLTVEVVAGNEQTRVLVTVDFSEYFKYGDSISFSGKLQKPENFVTDQGKEFDYVNYLRKDKIQYLMSYPEVEIIERGGGNFIKRALFALKGKFLEKINYSIREPESLLMGGLILGERGAFDEDLRRALVDTGTIHIVALSGYNVTIVAEWIMKIFSFLPTNFAFGAGVLGILLFVIMSGGGSTAIRAGTMAVLALVARATGRNYDVARALVLAGVIMIFLNPFVLVFDVSFQLSFIATMAVIFLAPRIEKYFSWVPERFKMRDIVSVTLAAYLFVLPFILYKMGNLSLVALPANILILPFIPFTMALGFFTGLAGIIFSPLSLPVGFVSYILLYYELAVVKFFASVPFAAFSIPNFPLTITILIYVYFIYRLFWTDIKNFITAPF